MTLRNMKRELHKKEDTKKNDNSIISVDFIKSVYIEACCLKINKKTRSKPRKYFVQYKLFKHILFNLVLFWCHCYNLYYLVIRSIVVIHYCWGYIRSTLIPTATLNEIFKIFNYLRIAYFYNFKCFLSFIKLFYLF